MSNSSSTMSGTHSRDQTSQPEKAPNSSTPPANETTTAVTCPFHGPIFAMKPNNPSKNLGAIDRFLGEGPGVQSALFVRPDTSKPSTRKDCTCVGTEELQIEEESCAGQSKI